MHYDIDRNMLTVICFRVMKVLYPWSSALTVSISHKLLYAWPHIYGNFLTIVDADEIKRLGKRFRKLDLDNSGALSIDEFMSLPELQQNPLVQRVIDIFDADGNGEVDFRGTFSCMVICVSALLYFFYRIHTGCVAV